MLDRITHDAGIEELRLNRPPVNALHLPLVRKLQEEIAGAPGRGVRGLVISGSPGIFSAGLDVPTLLTLDRAGMTEFWRAFFSLLGTLARSPIPSVAAITGHSPAGGAVVSIFCDYRVMANGAFRIGLNEVQVGLSVPAGIQFALRRLVGTYRAERLLVAGAMIEAGEAFRIGMVDELAEPDRVVPRAHEWLGELLKLPPQAFALTRRMARADLIDVFADESLLRVEEFTDGWFGEESQTVLKALVAKLKAKT